MNVSPSESSFRVPKGLSFFVLGVLAGVIVMWSSLFLLRNDATIVEVHSGGYEFISPLLACEVGDRLSATELRPLRKKVEQIVKNLQNQGLVSHVSVYYRLLNSGPWFGIQEQEKFSPASLFKVPLLMAVLKLAEEDPELLMQKITFDYVPTEESNLVQNILPEEVMTPGESYTVEELLYRMIVHSDNSAAYLLNAIVSEDLYWGMLEDLGIVIGEELENFLTVDEYARIFRVLYNASYLNRTMSERALGLLAQSRFDQGILSAIPQNISVAHKFGERSLEYPDGSLELQLSECAIVYVPGQPYLLCIMTRGEDFNALTSGIHQVSTRVFDYHLEQVARKQGKSTLF